MDQNSDTSGHEDQPVLNFALVLQMDHLGQIRIESQNQGIPDALVVLFVETWLEHVKEQVKKPIRDSLIGFGDSGAHDPANK